LNFEDLCILHIILYSVFPIVKKNSHEFFLILLIFLIIINNFNILKKFNFKFEFQDRLKKNSPFQFKNKQYQENSREFFLKSEPQFH
jgi:hypothetical protein